MSQRSRKGKQPVTGRRRTAVLGIDKFVYNFSRHWLAIFNVIVALYVGLPILAPILMNAGVPGPARAIYTAYSPMCHQMASRSFFIGGEQYAYPRELANTNLTPLEAYIDDIPEFNGISGDLLDSGRFFAAARSFIGNDEMGYKMALCERDIAIYGFVLIGGILYAFIRRRHDLKPLPLIAFIIIGMGPIGLDGFSQLFGYIGVMPSSVQAIFDIIPVRESPPWLRSATGAWFGLTLVWLAYPNINQGMKESVRELEVKLTRAGVLKKKAS